MRTSLARLRVVQEAFRQDQEGYAQGRDYYRRMREGIITMHRGGSDPSELWKIVEAAPARMRENFTACAKGYEKWMRGKGLIWSRRPKTREWKCGLLSVTVNPELLINVDGEPHRVKLYFKPQPIKQAGANLVIHLFEAVSPDEANIAVLDARRSRLFKKTRTDPNYDVVLKAEALSFAEMWQAVSQQAQQRPAI
jgi:hypothetical protein